MCQVFRGDSGQPCVRHVPCGVSITEHITVLGWSVGEEEAQRVSLLLPYGKDDRSCLRRMRESWRKARNAQFSRAYLEGNLRVSLRHSNI